MIVYYPTPMAMADIDSLDDPRLDLFRNLKDGELSAKGNRFIVEGHFVVQRVLTSTFAVESVMIARRKLEEMRPYLREGTEVYVVPDSLVKRIVGFEFHTGVMAIALRQTEKPLDEFLQSLTPRSTYMILPETTSLQNMGALIRVAAAFGVDGILVGGQSVDPFYRLPIRVSMGNCFRIPIRRSPDLASDLAQMRAHWKVEMLATVLSDSALSLSECQRNGPVGLLFGGEGYGLSKPWLEQADRQITIPMSRGTDSLNVAVSAGIFLYRFMQEL